MKRALLIGIDYYPQFGHLSGCVNDARALNPLLSRNEDDSLNFSCRVLLGEDESTRVLRDVVLESIDELLSPGADFALLYFAGHGEPLGGDVSLLTSDGTTTTPGVKFSDVIEKISASLVKEVVVILDCCFSGAAGSVPAIVKDGAVLRQGLSVLTASRGDQVSLETPAGRGQFSTYLEGALEGGAADVLGHVNVSGLYAYLSESFGAWEQRPTFKANIDRLHDVRRCDPRLPVSVLRNLTAWFPKADSVLSLDPSFEPTEEPRDEQNEQIFAGLQKLRACRLIEPVNEEHLYYAAMNSTGCILTALGRHYWQLAARDQL